MKRLHPLLLPLCWLILGDALPQMTGPVKGIKTEHLPNFDLRLNAYYKEQDGASITARASIPFYDGGETRARVRQAKEIHVSRLQEIEQARADTQASLTAAWSALMGQRAKLKSDQVQVEANRIALEGVREEQKVGQRTLLDVLNAEQEQLESQNELVSARREVVVASYKVLAATGQVSAEQLGLTARVYDPAVHLEESRQNWFGIDITHADGRHESYEAMESSD